MVRDMVFPYHVIQDSSSARDVFPGIDQAGLVLEAYLKETFTYGRCEEDTN